jgi:phosphonate transport system permease protein
MTWSVGHRPSPVPLLPPEQLAPLAGSYRAAVAAKRRRTAVAAAALLAAVVVAASGAEIDLAKLIHNIHRLPLYLIGLIPSLSWDHLAADIGEWFWNFDRWLKLLIDTLLIAYTGTLIGAIAGFCLCFPAASNLSRRPLMRFVVRRFLEFCRSVPDFVFALLFVTAFGLGAMPGVLALAIHTTGALGKLFAEVVENIDMRPVEGVTAGGASGVQMIRFAVLPQVAANLASYALLRFEINVRGAAVMLGFVGAGGIGQDLLEAVRKFYYTDVSAILVMIIVTVMLIDLGTERLRHHLSGLERP